jgi:hypothetical protein
VEVHFDLQELFHECRGDKWDNEHLFETRYQCNLDESNDDSDLFFSFVGLPQPFLDR